MTTASEWVRLAQSATLIDEAIALDVVWTRQLAAPISDQDRPALIELGNRLAGLARDIAGSLGPVEAWARDDPEGLGAAVDQGLEFAEKALGMQAAAQLRQDFPPDEWAGIVLAATAAIREEADAESSVLRHKVARLGSGEFEIGDFGSRFLVALMVTGAVITCAGPFAVLAGLVVPPAVGAVLSIAGTAAALAGALLTPTPPDTARTVQQIVDERDVFDRREAEMRAVLVANYGLTSAEARRRVAAWRAHATIGGVKFGDDYARHGLDWITR